MVVNQLCPTYTPSGTQVRGPWLLKTCSFCSYMVQKHKRESPNSQAYFKSRPCDVCQDSIEQNSHSEGQHRPSTSVLWRGRGHMTPRQGHGASGLMIPSVTVSLRGHTCKTHSSHPKTPKVASHVTSGSKFRKLCSLSLELEEYLWMIPLSSSSEYRINWRIEQRIRNTTFISSPAGLGNKDVT